MPEISRFYGIRILIYFDDHPPRHFHAEYGEYEAVFSIESGEIINGNLPNTAKKLVKIWHKLQKENIYNVWNQIQKDEIFEKVAPLE
jgi:hypothetical protein